MNTLVCLRCSSVWDSCSGATPLLVGFTDFDWAGDLDDRKPTVGYVFTLG